MSEPTQEERTALTVEMLNELVPALMGELGAMGFPETQQLAEEHPVPVPEGSVMAAVSDLLAELPPDQLVDFAFNAVIQLAMVHVKLNEVRGE